MVLNGFNVEAPCINASRWVIQKNPETFCCNKNPGSIFQKDLHEAYEQFVYSQKNIFLLPSGDAGKRFINEINRLLNLWANESLLKNVATKVIHVMPGLLLQKLSKSLRAKDHLNALERR